MRRKRGDVGNGLVITIARQAAGEGARRPATQQVSQRAVRHDDIDADVRREAMRILADPSASVTERAQALAALGEKGDAA